jgi:glycosyltransferase involved in cell wall biosynthesis
VLGSHYEGSGYALSEALRCGCIPIVTDIPSFRMMTNNGQLGALWQTGNKESFIEAVSAAIEKPLLQESNVCIEFFKKTLSFDAIAKQALPHYQQAVQYRLQKKSA